MKKTIIAAFIVVFLFKLVISFLDYCGSSSPELLNEILKYFTQSDITKGENYARRGFGIAIIRNTIFAFLILLMSFSSLSKKLEGICARLAKQNFYLTSVYYIAIIYSISALISLPFNFYFSYITEHRFGFSNMTMEFWFWTWFKSYALNLIFISAIGGFALVVIRKIRLYSVFVVPVGGLIIGFAMMIIYPLIILPIFYEIKTIDNPSLEKKIMILAHNSGVSVDKIYVIKESEYSKHTNAFFVGFGSSKKIYLYDNLIRNNTDSEVISILAHEIGHWEYNHNMKGVLIGFLVSLGVFISIYIIVKTMRANSINNISEIHSPSMIPLYLLLFTILSTLTNPLEMAVSRKMETNADYFALKLTQDSKSFISSEIRIARDNSSRLNKHPISAFFRSSHPMTIERIKMAEKYEDLMNRVNH